MSDVDSITEDLARDVDLDAITSSVENAVILETLRDGSCTGMGIVTDHEWAEEDDFVVREGDNLFWLGHFIGESPALESLWLSHLPTDDSFRQGLAQNQSIQKIYIWSDLGEAGFQSLAPFFRSTTTLKEFVCGADISSEAARAIASLLRQCQIKSLTHFELDDIDLSDEGYAEIARALSVQPQLETLSLRCLNVDNGCRGHTAIGSTMTNWISPGLKTLDLGCNDLHDDDLLALVQGMANCSNLELLNLEGNESITLVGFRALSTLFRSKKILLLSIVYLSTMNIGDDAMTALASGLPTLQSLKSLDLSHNAIGDVGLQSLAAGLANCRYLEDLDLRSNASFSAIGLRSLSDMLLTASKLKTLELANNSIDDEGIRALAVGMKESCTLGILSLDGNSISCDGLRSLTAAKMNSLHRLSLAGNAINDEGLETLVDGIGNLCNLETLLLSRVTSSGLSILATIFHLDRNSLKVLHLCNSNIGDSGAEALAEGLRGNKSDFGWRLFEKLLCDTSSVNNTYHSNHTLEVLGYRYRDPSTHIPSFVNRFLDLNRQKHDNVNVPICKILMSHSDFDMTPFFQWKLKLLPSVVMWFERARPTGVYLKLKLKESTTAFEKRKLSAVYQFISGFSHLVADAFCSQKSSVAVTKKRKFESNQRVK